MPTDPLFVDAKVVMQLGQCKEEDATLKTTVPMTDNWLPH